MSGHENTRMDYYRWGEAIDEPLVAHENQRRWEAELRPARGGARHTEMLKPNCKLPDIDL
jgi:hypothetical protein